MSGPRRSELSTMAVDLLPGDQVQIGDVTLELVHKTGRYARVRIRAPREVPIRRARGAGPADEASKPVPSMAECCPD